MSKKFHREDSKPSYGNAGYRIHQVRDFPNGVCRREIAAIDSTGPRSRYGQGIRSGGFESLERAARNLWQRHCAGGDSVFDDVFAALCRRYDGLDWDTDVLQGAIETEIAEEAEISIQTIRVALDAEIKGREVVIPEFVPIKEPPQPESGVTAVTGIR